VKAERRARFMELSAEISAARWRAVGRTMQVLIDRLEETSRRTLLERRPEIDGTVRIRGATPCRGSLRK
jgi:tRNA A37 methylthiotransferase MiaB